MRNSVRSESHLFRFASHRTIHRTISHSRLSIPPHRSPQAHPYSAEPSEPSLFSSRLFPYPLVLAVPFHSPPPPSSSSPYRSVRTCRMRIQGAAAVRLQDSSGPSTRQHRRGLAASCPSAALGITRQRGLLPLRKARKAATIPSPSAAGSHELGLLILTTSDNSI